MQSDVEIEIMLKGRERTLLLPRVGLHNVAPALERLDWLRRLDGIYAPQGRAHYLGDEV